MPQVIPSQSIILCPSWSSPSPLNHPSSTSHTLIKSQPPQYHSPTQLLPTYPWPGRVVDDTPHQNSTINPETSHRLNDDDLRPSKLTTVPTLIGKCNSRPGGTHQTHHPQRSLSLRALEAHPVLIKILNHGTCQNTTIGNDTDQLITVPLWNLRTDDMDGTTSDRQSLSPDRTRRSIFLQNPGLARIPSSDHTNPPSRFDARHRSAAHTPSPRRGRRLSYSEPAHAITKSEKGASSEEGKRDSLYRRVPRPHPSSRLRDRHSLTSLRSHVSFQSVGSEDMEQYLEGSGRVNDAISIDPCEPHFGSSRGIGPAGDAIEVIGLGRKEPRHRKFSAEMLKPALRGSSWRLGSTSFSKPSSSTSVRGRDKPLPPRPASLFPPVTDRSARGRARHASDQRLPSRHPVDDIATSLLRPISEYRRLSISSFFSSLSLGPSFSASRDSQRPPSSFGRLKDGEHTRSSNDYRGGESEKASLGNSIWKVG